MAEPEDRDGLAAEFALGTLSPRERAEAERLIAADPGFAARAAQWENRLSPLALSLVPVDPPSHLRDRILQAVAGGGDPTVVVMRRKAQRWRAAAIAAMALAAALAGFIVFRAPATLEGGRYVAVLQAEGTNPAFLASVDLAAGTIRVRTMSAAPQPGKSYELWAAGAGREKPESLGVIDADFRIGADKLGKIDPSTLQETIFAVSLEPEGGSPTGQATGPVLFVGKLVPAE